MDKSLSVVVPMLFNIECLQRVDTVAIGEKAVKTRSLRCGSVSASSQAIRSEPLDAVQEPVQTSNMKIIKHRGTAAGGMKERM